uniref:Uncharacterized protein n=1 Tax=Rhizophora mucronata TaxID=61149 RepID=A0A2P2NQA3_RHIMU
MQLLQITIQINTTCWGELPGYDMQWDTKGVQSSNSSKDLIKT